LCFSLNIFSTNLPKWTVILEKEGAQMIGIKRVSKLEYGEGTARTMISNKKAL